MIDPSIQIRQIPADERPRERLLEHGGATLSDGELLAVLLRTGRPGTSVLELARDLLTEFGGLTGLPGLTYKNLRRRGLREAKAATILAALEIGRRLAQQALPERRPMDRPDEVARYLLLRYCLPDQEVMGALFLDVRHRLLGEKELFRGTLCRTSVEPRAILKEALLRGAAGVLIFHTHPSGDAEPSPQDKYFTHRMVEAGDAVGITVVDHLILSSHGRFVSLKGRGIW